RVMSAGAVTTVTSRTAHLPHSISCRPSGGSRPQQNGGLRASGARPATGARQICARPQGHKAGNKLATLAEGSEKGSNDQPDKDTARQSSGTEPAADNYRSGGALCRNSPRTRQVRSHHDVFSRLSSRAICLE